MTVIAGIPGVGTPSDDQLPFVVMGADSEEVSQGEGSSYSSTVRKIEIIEGTGFKCAIGGAGNGDFIDAAIQQARTEMQPPFTLESIREQIEDIVTQIYVDRIDQYPAHQQDDLAFSLLGAIWVEGTRDVELIKVRRALSLIRDKPTSIGLGGDLTHYIISNLYFAGMRAYAATRFMVYLLAQLKKFVPDVGGNSQVVVLDGDGTTTELFQETVTQHDLSTSTVMEGAKWLFHYVNPMGFGYDMNRVDGVVDLVAVELKAELRRRIGGMAATAQAAVANTSLPICLDDRSGSDGVYLAFCLSVGGAGR